MMDWLLTKWKEVFIKEEDRILENSLVRAYGELRDRELRQVKFSHDFESRLRAAIHSVEVYENPRTEILKESAIPSFLQNKKLQYALTGFLVLLLTFSITLNFSRNTDTETKPYETAITDSSNLDKYSAMEINSEEESLLNAARANPSDRETLSRLEKYYRLKGDHGKADAIQQELKKITP